MIKEHKITGVWVLRDGKNQATTSARKEDDTNSDKKGPSPCNGYLGNTEIMTDHEDKRKTQVTTTVCLGSRNIYFCIFILMSQVVCI